MTKILCVSTKYQTQFPTYWKGLDFIWPEHQQKHVFHQIDFMEIQLKDLKPQEGY